MSLMLNHKVTDKHPDFVLINETIAVNVKFLKQVSKYLIGINVRFVHGFQCILAETLNFFVIEGAIVIGVVDLPHVRHD